MNENRNHRVRKADALVKHCLPWSSRGNTTCWTTIDRTTARVVGIDCTAHEQTTAAGVPRWGQMKTWSRMTEENSAGKDTPWRGSAWENQERTCGRHELKAKSISALGGIRSRSKTTEIGTGTTRLHVGEWSGHPDWNQNRRKDPTMHPDPCPRGRNRTGEKSVHEASRESTGALLE
jgi:hypothetical protein